MDYNQPTIIQLLNLSSQLDNINLAQLITKQCLILFSLWYKKFALAMKEKTKQNKTKTLKQNMVRSKCLNNIWSQFF